MQGIYTLRIQGYVLRKGSHLDRSNPSLGMGLEPSKSYSIGMGLDSIWDKYKYIELYSPSRCQLQQVSTCQTCHSKTSQQRNQFSHHVSLQGQIVAECDEEMQVLENPCKHHGIFKGYPPANATPPPRNQAFLKDTYSHQNMYIQLDRYPK